MNYFPRSGTGTVTGASITAALATLPDANLLTDTQVASLANIRTDEQLQDDVAAVFRASDIMYDDAGNQIAINVTGSSGLVSTVSNGATIWHDGAGTNPPTYTVSSGVGTLVSNGNNVRSISGNFDSSSGGGYQFNHDSPSQTASPSAFDPTGFPPVGASPRRISATRIDWFGLTANASHFFTWTF